MLDNISKVESASNDSLQHSYLNIKSQVDYYKGYIRLLCPRPDGWFIELPPFNIMHYWCRQDIMAYIIFYILTQIWDIYVIIYSP